MTFQNLPVGVGAWLVLSVATAGAIRMQHGQRSGRGAQLQHVTEVFDDRRDGHDPGHASVDGHAQDEARGGEIGTVVVEHDPVVGTTGADEVRGTEAALVRGTDPRRALDPLLGVRTMGIERTHDRDRDHLAR